MKRILEIGLVLIIGFSSIVFCGCQSEQSKLEAEKTRLEIEKLKQEAADEAVQKKAEADLFKTDKLKDFKANTPF